MVVPKVVKDDSLKARQNSLIDSTKEADQAE